jgi:hypothetical protein
VDIEPFNSEYEYVTLKVRTQSGVYLLDPDKVINHKEQMVGAENPEKLSTAIQTNGQLQVLRTLPSLTDIVYNPVHTHDIVSVDADEIIDITILQGARTVYGLVELTQEPGFVIAPFEIPQGHVNSLAIFTKRNGIYLAKPLDVRKYTPTGDEDYGVSSSDEIKSVLEKPRLVYIEEIGGEVESVGTLTFKNGSLDWKTEFYADEITHIRTLPVRVLAHSVVPVVGEQEPKHINT